MSVRAIGTHLFKYGRTFVRHICKRDIQTTADKINAAQQLPPKPHGVSISKGFGLRTVGVQIGLQARKLLINNVLNRVTNSLASDLRKRAARRILYGDSGPFFALVGVSLASGTGILTREDELEGVCWEIREAISKIKWHYHDIDIDETRFENSPITLNDLSLGKPIAKGANAVVYAAKIKNQDGLPRTQPDKNAERSVSETIVKTEDSDDIEKFPLALKMMFNYDIQSSAMAILNAMYRETVPAREYYSNVRISDWEIDLSKRNRHLPPHPNVVAMFSVFTDYVPELQDCRGLYPAALPQRIHPDGDGRNMSLFLLMKRYDTTLADFLTSHPPSARVSLLLFAQLLEAVAHLTAHGIAHRDLKTDNILIDTAEPEAPILVLADFGCCLADKANGLRLPYTSHEVDKGGNVALMAPEIACPRPGAFCVLDYGKSDLWAAAAITYEVFSGRNPFCVGTLRSVDYEEEQLPEMGAEVPYVLRRLVGNLLQRKPSKRLNPEVAANVCQLILWAPSTWLKPETRKPPSSAEILQWLLSLTTKILCEGRMTNKAGSESIQLDSDRAQLQSDVRKAGRRTYPEYLLISCFLARATISNVKAAISWIQTVNADIDD
ncbi:unnamed protein product [Phaedon cochleariae]|uniref:non-specific serine/threonine protein kinase n=1 Tax=Phaedon cochleariae TaxID=80249 RepID=A0A9P0DDA7_PHACE|nr:unnamed protein product [Phaedon cochleariae]